MITHSFTRQDLVTDRSIQLSSNHCDQEASSKHHFLQKAEDHLAFMERQFKRNLEWQRELLLGIKQQGKQHKRRSPTNRCNTQLQITQQQEQLLKQLLLLHFPHLPQHASLQQMLRQADAPNSPREIIFPVVPHVITLDDLAPSTRRHIQETPSPMPILPRHQKVIKNRHLLFSPAVPVNSPSKDINFQPNQQIADSFDRRLEDFKLPTFYKKSQNNFIQASQNISLNFSSSNRKISNLSICSQQSLLLPCQEEAQKPTSIYEKLQERPCESERLCFGEQKKKKIPMKTKISKNGKDEVLLFQCAKQNKENENRMKRLQDSFGKVYHQLKIQHKINSEKQEQRQTLQSDRN